MSAQTQCVPRLRPMRETDLDAVVAVEHEIYSHPWTRGNFEDSLRSGYPAWVLESAGELRAYGVLMMGVGEAHLLNLSVARSWQRRGIGRDLLAFLAARAREMGAATLLLEVRPSNGAARALYAAEGFRPLAVRRNYYPAHGGREDAVIMELSLAVTAP
ncbi:MAG: ribosomal protein S18-alanine N-acetyltransferase [Rhodocyclaceae bacterium]|jgi:ribosomal-protein-alanine N-acetyltransferase|nr:ribosomal protein S18-alanine N-acetyltransferase [Rhodocyclaceae bacterium]MCA3133199.1 ribosomal protein S18-alanine N-acetyltransferase [Rhodocyclaceae bacterium]MCA3140610.1 ribosomal protein S18-alanine N-acetyltransferase [Rhodocyclaceae bacterium]MCA3144197.1 ribosomal protein S18-alanine N-acetyltransferase [Rhodocyclaceae bacterium]